MSGRGVCVHKLARDFARLVSKICLVFVDETGNLAQAAELETF